MEPQPDHQHGAMNSHPHDAAEALDKLARWTSMETGRAQLQRVVKQFAGWDLLDTNRPAVTRLLDDVDAARLYWPLVTARRDGSCGRGTCSSF